MQQPSPRTVAWPLMALLGLLSPLSAQSDPFGDSAFPAPAPTGRRGELPRLTFKLYTDIPLPGPLPGESPRVVEGGRVEIPVAGALAVTALEQGARPNLLPRTSSASANSPQGSSDWVLSPNGRRRFRTIPSGQVLAQKCCAWNPSRWCRSWKLRVAGGTLAPPLVLQGRLFVGALDNQIYALRARNGHRIWTLDVGQRVSNPLAVWRGKALLPREKGKQPQEREVELILVVPDGGSTLLAVHAASGGKVASFELPDSGGRIVGAPASTEDGKVVVARQKYSESEATLIVFQLEAPTTTPASGTAQAGPASD